MCMSSLLNIRFISSLQEVPVFAAIMRVDSVFSLFLYSNLQSLFLAKF